MIGVNRNVKRLNTTIMEKKTNYKQECDELVLLAKRTKYQTECLAGDVLKRVLKDTTVEKIDLDISKYVLVKFDGIYTNSGIAECVSFNRKGDGLPSVSVDVLTPDNRINTVDFKRIKFVCVEDMLNIVGQIIEKANLD